MRVGHRVCSCVLPNVKQLDDSQGSDSTMTMMVKSRESGDRIEDENDAESPKIRKKIWSFHAIKTNFSRGTRGGQNGENPSVYGGLMVFLHT